MGTPELVHPLQDEGFEFLSGSLDLRIGGQERRLEAGERRAFVTASLLALKSTLDFIAALASVLGWGVPHSARETTGPPPCLSRPA